MSIFAEKSEGDKKKRAVIGYDLGDAFSQISYWSSSQKEPETVSAVMGSQQYNIPTVLCKRKNTNQWLYGKEALKYAGKEGAMLVENLLSLAADHKTVVVEDEEYDPIALLAIFVKRSLTLLNLSADGLSMEGIMFTVQETTPEMIGILNRMAIAMQLKTKNIFFQGHKESTYYYMLHQPEELWKQDVVVFDYGRILKAYRLQRNPKTVPLVFFTDTKEYPDRLLRVWNSEEDEQGRKKEEDQAFLTILKKDFADNRISTAYLVGDGFKGGWTDESIRFLCYRKRVFQGNNLYSKGACYAAREKITPGQEMKKNIYLGEDKLKANIGVKILKRGEDVYYALMDAGSHWYETKAECEVILRSGNEVSFLFTSLTGGIVTEESILLEDLPKRKEATTRLNIKLKMVSADEVEIIVEDKGFGEFVPATHKLWKKVIKW